MPGAEPETPEAGADARDAEGLPAGEPGAASPGEEPAATSDESAAAAEDLADGSAPEPPAGPAATTEDPLEEALPLVEALLFAASKPVAIDKLAEAAEIPAEVVERAVASLEESCAAAGRGIRVDRVAGGVRLVSRPEYDYPVRRLLGLDGKTKLSMAALETLAIVAYRQPVTGPEVAELRGVNSSSSIRTLLDRKLITTAGRKEVVGTPFLYKTTKEFLVHFGLKGIGDLPKPEELEAIYGLESPKPDPAQVELFHVDEATGELEDVAVEAAPEPADASKSPDGGIVAEDAAAPADAEGAGTAPVGEPQGAPEDDAGPGSDVAPAGEDEHVG